MKCALDDAQHLPQGPVPISSNGSLNRHFLLCHFILWPCKDSQGHWGWSSISFFFFSFTFWLLFLFFNFTILYWFCHISTWIRHRYTRVPHPEPSSLPIPSLWVVPVHQPQASSIFHYQCWCPETVTHIHMKSTAGKWKANQSQVPKLRSRSFESPARPGWWVSCD